jgi:general secretion pathway protein B
VSYILDALKKAEAERDPDTRASLAMEQRDRRRLRTLSYIVVAALLLNALVLVWLFYPASEGVDEPPAPAISGSSKTAPPASVSEPLPSDPIRSTAAAEPPVEMTGATEPAPVSVTPPGSGPPAREPAAISERTTAPTPASGSRSAQTAVRQTRVTVAELPPNLREAFPQLSFSTHVYADDPTLRAVVVNGTRLEEGDSLEGLVVQEITPDGAVFAYDRYLVSVPVLANW